MIVDDLIRSSFADAITVLHQLQEERAVGFVAAVSELLAAAFERGNKVLIAGNGGSLADAVHFAEELTGQFRSFRRALPAIALTEPSHITCTANDMGFEEIFARGIEALGISGDLFIGLSTSGNSPNMVRAFEVAKERELTTVALLGKGGGRLKGVADHEIIISGFDTSDRIQEAHMVLLHTLVEAVESLI